MPSEFLRLSPRLTVSVLIIDFESLKSSHRNLIEIADSLARASTS